MQVFKIYYFDKFRYLLLLSFSVKFIQKPAIKYLFV